MRRLSVFSSLAALGLLLSSLLPASARASSRESGSASLSDWARSPRMLRFSLLGIGGLGVTDLQDSFAPQLQVRSPEEARGQARIGSPTFRSRVVGEPRGQLVLQLAVQPGRFFGLVGGFRVGALLDGKHQSEWPAPDAEEWMGRMLLGGEAGLRQVFGNISFQEVFTWDTGVRTSASTAMLHSVPSYRGAPLSRSGHSLRGDGGAGAGFVPETVTQRSLSVRALTRVLDFLELGLEYSRYAGDAVAQDPRAGNATDWSGHGGALILGVSL